MKFILMKLNDVAVWLVWNPDGWFYWFKYSYSSKIIYILPFKEKKKREKDIPLYSDGLVWRQHALQYNVIYWFVY